VKILCPTFCRLRRVPDSHAGHQWGNMTNGRIPRLPIDVFITKVGVDSRSARHAPRVCPVREDAER
jgi:hypothetical protein